MKIAVEGCAHGELETIYNTIAELENQENVKIDLLICCGDFQSTRNLNDLQCMAVPQKYADICTFYKYYSGEKTAPYLTIFIGGNHEASNYLQELPYGGWVAPNIYYLGYAGVINIGGVRIGGISGIYKPFDYSRGHFEISPYDDSTVRSVYHIRNVDVFRLKQLTQPIDIFLSHDWPTGIHKYGNVDDLLKRKPFFKADIESNKLGSAPCEELLYELQPKYWFSAHLHCKFAALVPHSDSTTTTKFLALDKCLPRRRFLQVVDIAHDDTNSKIEIKYDLEWLTILFLTNHLLSVKKCPQYMPGPGSDGRWNFTPTDEEKQFVLEKFGNDLSVPLNFSPTVQAYIPSTNKKKEKPIGQTNDQSKLFCDKLCIDDPTQLLLQISELSIDNSTTSTTTPSKNSSLNLFVPRSVEIKHSKLNLSLPEPQNEPNSPKIAKLNLTLPPPKNTTANDSFYDLDSTVYVESSSFIVSESDSLESSIPNLSNTSFDDTTDGNVSSSTPQTKKFKRRNESIYKVEDD